MASTASCCSACRRAASGWPSASAPRSPASSARCRSARSTPRCTATTSGCGPSCPPDAARSRSTSTAPPSCSSTTCCSPAAPCAPPSTPSPSTAGPGPCSWPCSSTAATGSCRSGPTSSARTCRRAATRTCGSVPTAWRSSALGARPWTRRWVVKHLRSIGEVGLDGVLRLLDLTDTMVEVNQRPNPKVPALRGQDGVQPVLRGLDADPPVVRDGGQAAVGRRDDVQRRDVQRQQGREPARHDRDGGGDGRRRLRRSATARAACRGRSAGGRRRASSTAATAGTPTRPRRCSTPTPCARRSAARGGLDGVRIAVVGDIRHSRVARSDVEIFTAARRRRHARRPGHAAAAGAAGAGDGRPRLGDREGRRAVPVADATGADAARRSCRACGSTAPASG